MFKTHIKLEFVDVDTGEVTRTHEGENFIFFENYRQLWTTNTSILRPVIVGRGSDVFPIFDKDKNQYGRDQIFLTGYAPSGTSLRTFFQKTEDSPAYWDFYSLFLPPATLSSIPCISLSSWDTDNATYPTSAAAGDQLWSALNLDPYCWQAPTEYLNVYYRLILIEDEENESPDFIRNQFVMDITRGSSKVIFPNVNHKTYPFRIEESVNRDGFVNFISRPWFIANNSATYYPAIEHSKLINAQKTYAYPDASPNQYNQINYGMINMVIRGTGSARLQGFNINASTGISVGVNPIKITPDISTSFTGLGNVFASNKGSTLTIFDPAYFPAGSGRMQISGQLTNTEKDPFGTVIQCEIVDPSQSMAGATYKMYEYRLNGNHQFIHPVPLPLFPSTTSSSSDYPDLETVWNNSKALMYSNPNGVHYNRRNLVKYIENRSFITWDLTGITIYDIYHGKLDIFDINTTPSLAVTEINDVKVDSYGVIWISCGQTGLWKLHLVDATTIELTHIGVLPGSQQKCYAIDVDKNGAIYAIFWGTGLFYSIDGGNAWVNVPIDYPPFSGYESGGFVSKWSYVGRIICNPDRIVSNGVGQLLILMKSSAPEYTLSGGCWYDFQSQVTSGIVLTAHKNQFRHIVDNRSAENVQVSNYHNKWYFLTALNTLARSTFQQVTTMATYVNSNPGASLGILVKDWTWDNINGVLKEQLYMGVQATARHPTDSTTIKYTDVYDIQTDTVVARVNATVNNSTEFTGINTTVYPAAISLGKNLVLSVPCKQYYASSTTAIEFQISNIFSFSKIYRQWASTQWGWDGVQWVKNHMGKKPLHATSGALLRGASNRFTDGNAATVSWAEGDTFTFTAFDGFFKDNSSTMALRDTVYYKPTDIVETFDPNFVTRIDRTADTGILNRAPIELEWDINDLPDTTYSGEQVITNGDQYFNNVSVLALFNNSTGLNPSKGQFESTIGAPAFDPDFHILNEGCLSLNGASGFYVGASDLVSPSTTFTMELMLSPRETGKRMYLFDFRTTSNATAGFYISTTGKLAIVIGGVEYGNTGDFLFPGNIYYVKFTRSGNTWEAYINNVLQFTFENSSSFASPVGVHLFKRYLATVDGIEGFNGYASNLRITRAVKRAGGTPTAFYPTFGNSYSGAGLTLQGVYNMGAIVASRELVGDWQVIFRDINQNSLESRRSRPKLAFGVSALKYIESVTDIGYRVIGARMATFLTTYANSTTIPLTTNAVRITKVNNRIAMAYSTDGGSNWTTLFQNIEDLNPVHHIVMWQVQGDVAPVVTPAVQIVSNGSAIFSKAGANGSNKGRHNPKFIAMDCYFETDVNISLQGVKATKVRSNFNSPALPLQGEVLALQAGTIVFHEADIGKAITGKVITIRD